MCDFFEFKDNVPVSDVEPMTVYGIRPMTVAYKNNRATREKALPEGFDVPLSLRAVYRALSTDMKGLVSRVKSGELTSQAFADEAYLLIEEAHAKAWYLGRKRGGIADEFGDGDLAAGTVAADIDSFYLGNWRDDFDNGRYFDGEEWSDNLLDIRADAYARKIRGTANESFVTASEGLDVDFEWRLGSTEHCQDCLGYASLNPWLPDELPSFPGDCSTDCKHNCSCTLRRSDGVVGFDPF